MDGLSIEKLQLFLLVVLPGIVAIKVYDLFYPPHKRDFGSSLIEAICYGFVNLAIWVWPLLFINRDRFPEEQPVWYAVGSFFMLLVSPCALALLAVKVRTMKPITKRIGWPNKTAWDDFFKRGCECWILFHLKNGKMLGGYFGKSSYATTFPDEPEIYVQEVWRVDELGKFVECEIGRAHV